MEKTAYSSSVREWSMQPLTAVVAYLGLDGDVQRGSRGLSADGSWAERAREMEEGVMVGHIEGLAAFWGGAVVVRLFVGGVFDVNVVGQLILFAKSGQVRSLARTT
jgi:hypothetical protein